MAFAPIQRQTPSTLQQIGTGLQAFGEGVQGRGSQFQALQQQQARQLDKDRKQAAADDIRRAKLLFDSGDIAGIQRLASERVGFISELGGDPSDTQGILDLSEAALGGDPNAFQRLGQTLNLGVQAAIEGGFLKAPKGQEGRTFAPIDIVDESGNVISVIPTVRDGKVVNLPVGARPKATPEQLAGLKVSSSGEIEEKKTVEQGKRDFKKQQVVLTVKQVEKGFEAATTIKANINTLGDAIEAIERGASTGVVSNFFPSIRASTLAFENAASRLGLDVVGSVTFGALSEGELKLAMQTAVPTNMSPSDLKVWLQNKQDAQKKLLKYMREQVTFLSEGNTVADWLNREDQPQQAQTTDFIFVDGKLTPNPDKAQ
ncbi:MAG: hypothetical protein COB09_17130 [Thalassobium sp.]|nr:MAG: hypothetical protein COB09_17130 [Thalassobium sp.]